MSGDWSWDRCEQVAARVLERLDWRALGRVYFHGDGEARWQALRPRVLELGMVWARALLRRLPQKGRSLHVGAGVAELPVLLCERLLRGRDVVAVNRRARECEAIAAALQRCGLQRELSVRQADAAAAAASGSFDHLGCVSLFTDPESWPLCSAVAYGRIAPVQLDVAAFAAERDRARALAAALCGALERPAWITTSVEEVAWFLDAAAASGRPIEADDETVATAVVGDPIGFLRAT
jgi:hypothetical protein